MAWGVGKGGAGAAVSEAVSPGGMQNALDPGTDLVKRGKPRRNMDVTIRQKILVVDDVPTSAAVLESMLRQEWDVMTAFDGDAALRLASEPPVPDLILLDINMPGIDGREVCRRLKKSPVTKDIPIIFVTAMDSGDSEAHGLGLGAVDYIVKPVNAPIVRARVRNHIALRKALVELQSLATLDPLTSLFNRRKLQECLALEVSRAECYARPLSVILFDVDHFKAVNDTHGHAAGDAALMETGRWLRASVRASDVPGRWGGEEFLVVCPETPLDEAMQIAERLRQEYADLRMAPESRLTASFGVASHRAGLRVDDLLRNADDALYRAKNAGRNRVEREL